MTRTTLSLLLAGLMGVSVAGAAPRGKASPPNLREGVKEIAAPGLPGPLCVFGPRAFPVVVGRTGKSQAPVVAAGQLRKGRVVAFGHTGYFDATALASGQTGRLILNSVHWSAGGKALRVGVRGRVALVEYLNKNGVEAAPLTGDRWTQALRAYDVLCCDPANFTEREVAAVQAFARQGGGLLVAGLGWGWLQLNPGKTLEDHPGNRLIAPAGIVWADSSLQRTSANGFSAEERPSEFSHAGRALAAVLEHADGLKTRSLEELAQAVTIIIQAVHALPARDRLLRPRIRRLTQERQPSAHPSPEQPLKPIQALDRLLLTMAIQRDRKLPAKQIQASAGASAFPGAVPKDAPRVSRTVTIDTRVPDWHSTGLYAAPGDLVKVEIPAAAAGKRLRVRIGAHKDRLWHKADWKRAPEITRTFPLDEAVTGAANAYGGALYIEVPRNCELGTITVKISNAVAAPHYVLGRTTLEEWRETIRKRPAPWAELESSKIILTVPSKVVRKLDDPESLMKFWDQVADACADLATIPRRRPRPERYVTDAQISAGYMHAGYPIMTWLDVTETIVDRERMMRDGHGGVWGFFHEIGHNHQVRDWTFDGTGEVTCNLFTLYVFEQACGTKPDGHKRLSPEVLERRIKAHLAAGADFNKWKSDPFLALMMYMQLQAEFGWEAFQKVFAEYRGLAASERPRTDDERRDQWLVRFSRTVGKNLGPFFQTWGVPTSQGARQSIADLPVWLPAGFPSS